MIRKIIIDSGEKLSKKIDGNTLEDILMEPTKIYVKSILSLLDELKVHAMAHITGGGISGNIPRVLPNNLKIKINRLGWNIPSLFEWIREKSNLDEAGLFSTFNCGIGMVIILSKDDEMKATKILQDSGEEVFKLGLVYDRRDGEEQVEII